MVETMLCGPQISLHFPFPEYRGTYTSQFCFVFTKLVGLEEVMGVGNGYKAYFIIFLSIYLVSFPMATCYGNYLPCIKWQPCKIGRAWIPEFLGGREYLRPVS